MVWRSGGGGVEDDGVAFSGTETLGGLILGEFKERTCFLWTAKTSLTGFTLSFNSRSISCFFSRRYFLASINGAMLGSFNLKVKSSSL
ncbi:hypothetical protein WICPIJ_004214 [Wickerhamomyces pijperi]|uniref:Uncharacterized protein n=1 Tax=Wickerhamomyces pijperi TaxID=599730 RepID=A0A9P8Q8F4_WICPI|nr:hypothetical protein WICPIJ_004214 [Wickerhamomyces pijperi]